MHYREIPPSFKPLKIIDLKDIEALLFKPLEKPSTCNDANYIPSTDKCISKKSS